MSLSLWPNECFRAVLIRDAALKQHLEGYWRRETHHVYAPDLVGVWVNTSSCSCVLCLGVALQCCWTQVLLIQAWLQALVCSALSSPHFFLLTAR